MKTRTNLVLVTLAITLMAYCKPIKPEGEGITGTVSWLEGNQMPSISDEEGSKKDNNPTQNKVQRTLLIYPLTNVADTKMENGVFTTINGDPVTTVETDENGHYQLKLNPGRYSVFTQEENGLFANIFDGDGNIQPVTIKESEWVLLDIVINYKAVY